jgi:hypothetical protein
VQAQVSSPLEEVSLQELPRAASHAAAEFYPDCEQAQVPNPLSATPSATAARLNRARPLTAWPAVASGRGCARLLNLPRT